MIKNKELIKKRFSKSLKTYSDNAIVQKQMAKKLVDAIPNFNFKKILELGCGTGFITEEAASKINFSDYFAVDIVPECKKYISKISDKIQFVCGDIEDNDKIYGAKYDLIISNATLQWLDNLPQFIQKLRTNLTAGGYLIFTVFGKENYKEMAPFIQTPLKYYSVDEIKNFCMDFEIIKIAEEKFVMEFNTPKDVLRHIKNTGVNAISTPQWTKKDLINFEKEYSKEITLTYHPIYVILKQC